MTQLDFTNLTVVPSDNVIIIDRRVLYFEFPAPKNLHALQWSGGAGWLEFIDTPNNQPLSLDDYDEHVRPFVEAFKAEAARLDALEAAAAEARQ